MKYIGIDIGGTKCAISLGLVDESIIILDKLQFATANQPPFAILDKFSTFIDKHIQNNEIAGIGISCGGPLNSKLGIIQKPPSLPLWDNIEIVKYFEEKYKIKTYLQNDANACAVAEWKYGAGKGYKNIVFLTFGTGFGAGLILNDKLYVGANDNAGEVGHIRLTSTGPIGYNKKGSVEGYCSGSGLKRLAFIMAKKEKNVPDVIKKYGNELSAKVLAEYANNGDKFALSVYKKCGKMLGVTLSGIIDFINPEIIVLGGVFMRSEYLIMPHARKVIDKETLPFANSACKIVGAGLKENIGDIAALVVAKGDYL